MPLYDPAGNPLPPVPVVGAKKFSDYEPLAPTDFAALEAQTAEGLQGGVSDGTPVTVPFVVLVRLVQTVRFLAQNHAAAAVNPVSIDLTALDADYVEPAPASIQAILDARAAESSTK